MIQPLEEDTRSKIRSTQILTSLAQLVSELVQNALDAKANNIDVGVDPDDWSCWVRDDGTGMSRDGMVILGQGYANGRYGTSKVYTPASLDDINTFGFRGEALASAADLSCMEISSRTSSCRDTWSIIVRGGHEIYFGPALRWRRERPGTVVCIRDAFYNLPVRRRSHPSSPRTVDTIRRDLETIAFVFPHVAFSLESSNKGRNGSTLKNRVLTITRSPSMLTAFQQVHGKALVEHVDEINITQGDLRLQGFISLEGHFSKAYQFLYINRHPIDPCDLHREIESSFGKSSFGRNAFDALGPDGAPDASRRSPRKTEYRAVYCLNLSLPQGSLDVCVEPSKSTVHFENPNSIRDFLTFAVQSFLARNGFFAGDGSAAYFPHRTGSHYPPPLPKISPSPRKRVRIEASANEEQPERRPGSQTTVLELRQPRPLPTLQDNTGPGLNWTNLERGESFLIDPRTGNSAQVRRTGTGNSANHSDEKIALPNDPYVDRRWLKEPPPSRSENLDTLPPAWIHNALKSCQASIFRASRSASALEVSPDLRSDEGTFYPKEVQRKFTRQDLRTIDVIGQADCKFIACLTRPANDIPTLHPKIVSGALLLVDQHAADERVRVEQLLRDMALGFLSPHGAPRTSFETPIPVVLSRTEAFTLLGNPDHIGILAQWGFAIQQHQDIPSQSQKYTRDINLQEEYIQIFVETAPTALIEKLRRGAELRDVLKGFVAKWEEDGDSVPPAPTHEGDAGPAYDLKQEGTRPEDSLWLKALRWCPVQLLDLVNSKACRGAIMFNDPLDLDQCERLIHQLSETTLPFQCAHGRPSFVPLISLGPEDSDSLVVGRTCTRPVSWSKLARFVL